MINFVLLLLSIPIPVGYDISGRILENDTWNTPLYGATIYFPELETGTTTNLQGYFSLTGIPGGIHPVRISFVGYATHDDTLRIPADSALVFRLDKIITEMDELRITAKGRPSQQAEQARVSTINVTDLPLNNIPRFMGEPDLIRVIQNLPGVKTESDFTGGFHVRGGRNDQNLILLDGVPVYNPWHLFGLFSAFNSEALEKVELTKGVFPARYGGRVSSVLDISLQEGSERHGAGYLTVSPLSSSFSFGRPINQNTSLLLAVRRTYMDPLFWLLSAATTRNNDDYKEKARMNYNFQDINMKVVHRFTPKISLETAMFRSHDRLRLDEEEFHKQTQSSIISAVNVGWRNTTGSAKLLYKNQQWNSSTHFYVSGYFSKIGGDATEEGQQDIINNSYVLTDAYYSQWFTQYFMDYGFRQDLTFFLSEYITLHTGGQWIYHDFRDHSTFREEIDGYYVNPDGSIPYPAPPTLRMEMLISGDSLRTQAQEAAGFATFSLTLGRLSLHPGLRFDWYSAGNYSYLQPRLNASFELTPRIYISAGYGHFTQYIHVLGLDLLRMPSDRWFWSDDNRMPVSSKATTIGFGFNTQGYGAVTLEGYHKTMDNLLSFSPQQQADAFLTGFIPHFDSQTISGSGESYGVETLWHGNYGSVTGWLGYTLSWSWNEFEELNHGNRFPARTDKRHDMQTFVSWDLNEEWSIGLLFNFRSGQPVTFTTAVYLAPDDPMDIDEESYRHQTPMVITEMNNFRLPAYHRLDLNITRKNRTIFNRPGEVSLNVMNVYNRINPLLVTSSSSVTQLPNGNVQVNPNNKYFGQIPILPVLSMRITLGGDAK